MVAPSNERGDGLGRADRVDEGFTHVALQVTDLTRSLDFYRRYAGMVPVHRRTSSDGVRVAWIADNTRPFVIVLLETPLDESSDDRGTHGVTHPLGGWSHLGIGVGSRDEVDRLLTTATAEGLVTAGPHDSGPPAGYYGIVVDPDGHNLEIAFGQQVDFTLEHPGADPAHPTELSSDGTAGTA